MAKSAYNEDSIQHFKGLEGVRAKPGMYLGERGSKMVFTCVREAVDNSADEYAAGRNSYIEVVSNPKTNTYIIADKGNGIPVGINKVAGISTLTLVLTELHAGGKFHDKAYTTAAGSHGIGVAASNAVCESFEVWTHRENSWHFQPFSKGRPLDKVKKVSSIPKDVLKDLSYKPTNGTIIRMRPEQSIVSSDGSKAILDRKVAKTWLRNLAMLNKGLTVVFTAGGKTTKMVNTIGIVKVVNDLLKKQELEALTKPIVLESNNLSMAIQWTSNPDDASVASFVSSTKTRDGGSHLDEFYDALAKSLSRFKGKSDKYTPKDLRYGLIGVINYKMSQPEFSSQVKDRLTSNLKKDVYNQVLAHLDQYLDQHKSVARKIIKRANDIKKTKDEFSKLMKTVTTINKGRKGVLLPAVLASAKCTPDKRELFLVEGESAAGSGRKARDSAFQEVLPLTGKFSNALRTPMAKLLKTKSIQNILIALGYNHAEADPVKSLRVQRLYFLSDPDSDGSHINALLATLLYKLVPKLYEEGRIYVCNAPLFVSYYKGSRYFGSTFQECYTQLPKGAPKEAVQRLKGWGECNPEMLEIIAFNPQYRNVIQLKPVKGKEEQYFLSIMGSDSGARKLLLGV